MLFSYKIFTFSQLFSQHPNKFYYRKFQNHSQILIHGTNHSQIPTPHTTKIPIQPTTANSGNQKPQPPKHHYHTTTIPPQQQQKSKSHRNQNHRERERSVGRRLVGRRRDRAEARSSGVVRLARCCDRQDWCDLVRAIVGLELRTS